MMDKIKIGVIGTGNMGRNHVRVARNLQDLYEFVGIYDKNKEQADRIAEANNVKAFDELDQMLDHVDAVVVAVPSSLHKEIGLQVAEHGVHALIEKPLATVSSDARLLADAFTDKGLKLMVGHIERFNPVILELNKVLQDKTVFHIEGHRFSPFSGSGRITDTSVVEDLMIHDVDLVCHLMKDRKIRSVTGAGEHVQTPNLDFATSLLVFEGGAHATLSASRVSQTKERSYYIHATDCSIYADLLARTLTISTNANLVIDTSQANSYMQEGAVQKIYVPIQEPLQSELVEFYHVLNGDHAAAVDGAVGVRAIEICEEIVQKAEGGLK